MLNRRILRIKAFKELFAVENRTDRTLEHARAELDAALESTRDLYLFFLSSIPAITSAALARKMQLDMKINKTEEERNPNMKFIGNALAPLLENDPDFQKIIRKKKLSWDPYDLIVQKIYASIRTKDYFADYMASGDRSLKEDCALFSRIFEEEFVDREDLETALEDMSIYWNEDAPYSLSWCCNTLQDLGRGLPWRLPPLYLSSGKANMEDDSAYVHRLLETAIVNYDDYSSAVSSTVPNWDKDRLVSTDMAIIVCALCEIVHFKSIPVNVSINEWVEISKYFGTPKSSVFVNGIIDALSKTDKFRKL